MAEDSKVDVLIVGGGPVGLLIAYQLLRFSAGNLAIHIVEKHPKSQQDVFGRAVTFWSRSMELLDQIGLAQEIAQQCFACRTAASFDAEGNEIQGRGWSFLEDISDTKWNFASVLRQKYVEEIFRLALVEQYGVTVHAPAEFLSMDVDESLEVGDYRVTAYIQDSRGAGDEPQQATLSIKAKFIIGADGSRSAVRKAAKIETDGDSGEDKWVRIDGLVRTNNPKPRSYGAIESKTHGNVLWVPLDHGCTRIGFAFSAERMKKWPGSSGGGGGGSFSEEVAVAEAKEAVKPFDLAFERVDWASIYVVGQRVARKFYSQGCVFLAGDSCHTHSSGAGQGMNTGVHDAVNLSWKLSLVLRGLAKPELLETYEHERRPNAQKLIAYDKDISMLISHRLPASWKGDANADPNHVLAEVFKGAKGFNTGLTISFEPNLLNVAPPEEPPLRSGRTKSLSPIDTIPTPATAGYRAPDIPLQCPATFEPTTLHSLTPNNARFHIIVFAGNLDTSTGEGSENPNLTTYHRFTDALASSSLFSRTGKHNGCLPASGSSRPTKLPINFLTILAGQAASVYEVLRTIPSFSRVYFDSSGDGHRRYGIDSNALQPGKLLLLRPDGWIGMVIKFEEEIHKIIGKLEVYFEGFLV
ncbi:hypothetical protein N0V82_006014 [Gnomoniopsis sp. IMI 355080]|nr:hypothetical protein N0V82_006014 [Gnomoniopsis sp. IMI 355080]